MLKPPEWGRAQRSDLSDHVKILVSSAAATLAVSALLLGRGLVHPPLQLGWLTPTIRLILLTVRKRWEEEVQVWLGPSQPYREGKRGQMSWNGYYFSQDHDWMSLASGAWLVVGDARSKSAATASDDADDATQETLQLRIILHAAAALRRGNNGKSSLLLILTTLVAPTINAAVSLEAHSGLECHTHPNTTVLNPFPRSFSARKTSASTFRKRGTRGRRHLGRRRQALTPQRSSRNYFGSTTLKRETSSFHSGEVRLSFYNAVT
ncbi:hypothetical protein NM208_g14815 [Fusarium decemcellulare]|uniref:Uncharacterized protein n=1 Tax=Fusarium decemcellulare TaxID=57161 RepID=A0ACC1RFD6_9HYPO|nr:hypothetical protein NM208_g14815 [Fusarium decemcellulare]